MEQNKVEEVDDDVVFVSEEYHEKPIIAFNVPYKVHWFALHDIVNAAGQTIRFQFELRKTKTRFVFLPDTVKIVPMNTTMRTVRKEAAATYGHGELVDFDSVKEKRELKCELNDQNEVIVIDDDNEVIVIDDDDDDDDAEIVEQNDETTMESSSSGENEERMFTYVEKCRNDKAAERVQSLQENDNTSDLENDMNMANEINPSRQQAVDLSHVNQQKILNIETQIRAILKSISSMSEPAHSLQGEENAVDDTNLRKVVTQLRPVSNQNNPQTVDMAASTVNEVDSNQPRKVSASALAQSMCKFKLRNLPKLIPISYQPRTNQPRHIPEAAQSLPQNGNPSGSIPLVLIHPNPNGEAVVLKGFFRKNANDRQLMKKPVAVCPDKNQTQSNVLTEIDALRPPQIEEPSQILTSTANSAKRLKLTDMSLTNAKRKTQKQIADIAKAGVLKPRENWPALQMNAASDDINSNGWKILVSQTITLIPPETDGQQTDSDESVFHESK